MQKGLKMEWGVVRFHSEFCVRTSNLWSELGNNLEPEVSILEVFVPYLVTSGDCTDLCQPYNKIWSDSDASP